MTYDEQRALYDSDEAMARALFGEVAQLQQDMTRMEHLHAIDRHKLHKAEVKLYGLQHPIPKTNYNLEPA